MEFNYAANTRVLPASLQGAIPQREPVDVQSPPTDAPTQSSGTLTNVEGHTLPDGSAVSQDGFLSKQTTHETLSDGSTSKRTRSSSSNVSDAGRPGRESCRQRRRWQPQYASKEEQTRSTVSRAVFTVAATLTDAVGRSTDDNFRSSCLSLLQVRDTRQLQEAITRKLWQLSSEKYSLDGAVAGRNGGSCVDDSTTMLSARSSSQNVDSFDDLALNLTDADAHTAQPLLKRHSSKTPRTESCPVKETQREPVVDDWFSDIVDG